MAAKNRKDAWKNKVTNHEQIGGIETSVLDNGPAKGTRIAWVNTGSGLRYKVALDRGADIVDAFYNQHSLAWLSHGGLTAPRPDANAGIEWLWSFPGGLLITCGLAHVGGPEADEFGERGLHGRISNLPARLESVIQPDLAAGRLDMSITAVVKQSRVFGPNLELRRTISGVVGEPTVRIRDIVTNLGNTAAPHMILYHCNFGWPLVDEGADIVYNGKCTSRGLDMDNAVFNSKRNFKKCSGPIDSHRAGGEGCGYIDVKPDKKSFCTVGISNRRLGLGLAMKYSKKQLPCLANWQHFGPGEYVTALEPGTNPPIGQAAARKQRKLIHIAPGKSKTYDIEMTILTGRTQISRFMKTAGA
ncbi:MAG: aldose 1-epimerase family protein [Sedimentisphaerales bacterium]|nr:aldose 1-epimerase family protein [Sedimentisphaerales bacterium]